MSRIVMTFKGPSKDLECHLFGEKAVYLWSCLSCYLSSDIIETMNFCNFEQIVFYFIFLARLKSWILDIRSFSSLIVGLIVHGPVCRLQFNRWVTSLYGAHLSEQGDGLSKTCSAGELYKDSLTFVVQIASNQDPKFIRDYLYVVKCFHQELYPDLVLLRGPTWAITKLVP